MKLGFRITVVIGSLIFTSMLLISFLLVAFARGQLIDTADRYLAQRAREVSVEIGTFLETIWFSAETLSNVMSQYEYVEVQNRRNFVNRILESTVLDKPHILGAWVVFEPDALEGNDLAFIGIQGSNPESGGRFAPFWFRDGAGARIALRSETGDHYGIPMRTMRGALLCPYHYGIGGENVLISTISMPIEVNGSFRGVVGLDFSMEYIQHVARTNLPFPTSMAAVFSNSGIIAAHFIPGRPGGNMRYTEQPMAGDQLDNVIMSIRRGQPFNWSIFNVGIQDTIYAMAIPIRVANSDTPWSYVLAYPLGEALAPVRTMQRMAATIIIVAFLVTMAIMILLVRSVTKPIVRVVNNLKDISHGDGDLTKVLPEQGSDEITELSRYFNLTIGKIRGMVVVIKKQAEMLAEIGDELASNMTQTASSMNQIVGNIQSTKDRIAGQTASVVETNATMGRITGNIDKLSGHVDRQTSAVAETSSAIEQMLASISSVTATLVKNAENMTALKESSETGKSSLQEVAADVQEIAKESEGLLEINAVMNTIASQTNLLSMNAAIEAAHAGEAGRGFAVVANEIRKLAESSGKQSKTISSVLKKMKDSIDSITFATDNVLNKFAAIDNGVRIVAEQEEVIRNAMDEQSHGSRQILQASGQVNEITMRVKDGSREMLDGSKEVIKESRNLEQATQEITRGMDEMASGANEVNRAVNSVNELSGKNKQSISVLVEAISQFKV